MNVKCLYKNGYVLSKYVYLKHIVTSFTPCRKFLPLFTNIKFLKIIQLFEEKNIIK